jgi:hypothetical protein
MGCSAISFHCLLQVGCCHTGDYLLSQLDCCCPHLTKLVMPNVELNGTGVRAVRKVTQFGASHQLRCSLLQTALLGGSGLRVCVCVGGGA